MTRARACKQYTFRSYNIYFQFYGFIGRSFHTPVRKRRQKDLRVSNFTLLWVDFKEKHGSQVVNVRAPFGDSYRVELYIIDKSANEVRAFKVEVALLSELEQIWTVLVFD